MNDAGRLGARSAHGDRHHRSGTYVIAAGKKFELLRVNTLDEMALATPAAVGDRLLLRTESRLHSIRRAGSAGAKKTL